MYPRMMNRRSLCKTIVAMGLLSIVDSLKHLTAGEQSQTHEPNDSPLERHKDEQLFYVCACRPKFSGDPVTFLRKRETD